MTIDRAVLVVIDMQNGFINDQSRHVIPAVVGLLDAWTDMAGDVIFTRYHNYPGSPFERLINWSQLQASPDVDIVEALTGHLAGARAVLDKKIYSMFTPEGVAVLADGGWQDLIFCGVSTESCVLKSAVDAFELGLTPWIVTDACASNGGDTAHEAGLLVARRFVGPGQILDTAAVVRRFTESLET